MKEFDTQEETASSMASEPLVAYGETRHTMSMPHGSSIDIPAGYMSLERFGELFHQKLDACYAELHGDSKQ